MKTNWPSRRAIFREDSVSRAARLLWKKLDPEAWERKRAPKKGKK